MSMEADDYSGSDAFIVAAPTKAIPQGGKLQTGIQRYEQAQAEVSKKLEMINAKQYPHRIRAIKAKMVTFYKNGEPFHTGTKVSIQPGKHFKTLENLRDYLTERTKIPYGVRYIFTLQGKRIHELDDLEDGQSYVVSGTKTFHPYAYGQADKLRTAFANVANNGPLRQDDIRLLRPLTPSVKKNPPYSRITDRPLAGENSLNSLSLPNSREGRIITIVNNRDQSIRTKVLLNTRSPKPFEVVLVDLGQVINLKRAKRMFTAKGKEVRSFSQLKNDFRDVDIFYLDSSNSPRRPDGKEWKTSHSMEALGGGGASSFVARGPKLERSGSAPNLADVWENQQETSVQDPRDIRPTVDRRHESRIPKPNVLAENTVARNPTRNRNSIPNDVQNGHTIGNSRIQVDSSLSQQSLREIVDARELEILESEGRYEEDAELELMDSMDSESMQRLGMGRTSQSMPRSRMDSSAPDSRATVTRIADRSNQSRPETERKGMNRTERTAPETERKGVNRTERTAPEMERRGVNRTERTAPETERRGVNRTEKTAPETRPTERIKSRVDLSAPPSRLVTERVTRNREEKTAPEMRPETRKATTGSRTNTDMSRAETRLKATDRKVVNRTETTGQTKYKDDAENKELPVVQRGDSLDHRGVALAASMNSNSIASQREVSGRRDPHPDLPPAEEPAKPNQVVTNTSNNSREDTLPDKVLELDWIHGYNGQHLGRNLFVLPNGELLYNVAAIVVLYDRNRRQQRHYMGHTEDIQCLAIHPTMEFVASGQNAGRLPESEAHIRIWKPADLTTVMKIGNNEMITNVYNLAFSLQGLLMVLNASNDQELSMWDWQNRTIVGRATMPGEFLAGGVFHPQMEEVLVTYGRQHFSFWEQQEEGYLERKDVIPTGLEDKDVTCIEFLPNNRIVTGDTEGFIILWSPNSYNSIEVLLLERKLKAHESAITSLLLFPSGTLLSGDENGHIYAWDVTNKFAAVAVATLPIGSGGVRTLCPQDAKNPLDGHIYVGTTRNMIWEGSVQKKFRILQQGHYKGARALTVSPHQPEFFTGGLDNCFNKWGITSPFWKVMLESECLATSINPRGAIVTVGCANGKIVLFNAHTGDHMDTLQVTKAPINVLSYSPDGAKLAGGGHDGTLYLFDVAEDGSHSEGPAIKGTNPILSIDWTKDSNFIQTAVNDNEYQELVLWDVKSRTQVTDLPNADWQERTCSAGEDIHGMWDNEKLKDVINVSCHRSISEKLLAAGDEDGFVRLFRYPCESPKVEFYEYKQGSGSIAEVRFMARDKHLVSISSPDGSIFIWNVVPIKRPQ